MAVPTVEESALCSQLIERVKDYFQSAEHKKEFDFNIDRPLTESERRRTEYYCRYDVDATEILWKLRQGYLDNKVAVSW